MSKRIYICPNCQSELQDPVLVRFEYIIASRKTCQTCNAEIVIEDDVPKVVFAYSGKCEVCGRPAVSSCPMRCEAHQAGFTLYFESPQIYQDRGYWRLKSLNCSAGSPKNGVRGWTLKARIARQLFLLGYGAQGEPATRLYLSSLLPL